MSMERGSPGDGLIGGALIALNLILFVAGAINFGGGLFGLLLYIVVPACLALLVHFWGRHLRRTGQTGG